MRIVEPVPAPKNECLDLVWVLVGSMRKCVAAGWRENHAAQKITQIAFSCFLLFIHSCLSLCIPLRYLCSICAYLCVRVLQELVWRAGCVAVHSLKLDRASILPLLGSLTASHRASRQHAACCLCASLFLWVLVSLRLQVYLRVYLCVCFCICLYLGSLTASQRTSPQHAACSPVSMCLNVPFSTFLCVLVVLRL